ncbi:hypothetical protein C8R43DRAFT_1110598 [Mycena crocata]|nr:hypothetical protein C8R43DRAFT_1110598 [Mycena crocata]
MHLRERRSADGLFHRSVWRIVSKIIHEGRNDFGLTFGVLTFVRDAKPSRCPYFRMIFAIMGLEAVFILFRMHVRNYIAPSVDSLTASLATRLIMGIVARRSRDHDEEVESEPTLSFAVILTLGNFPDLMGRQFNDASAAIPGPEPECFRLEDPRRTVDGERSSIRTVGTERSSIFFPNKGLSTINHTTQDSSESAEIFLHGYEPDATQPSLEPETYGVWLPFVRPRTPTPDEQMVKAGSKSRPRRNHTLGGMHSSEPKIGEDRKSMTLLTLPAGVLVFRQNSFADVSAPSMRFWKILSRLSTLQPRFLDPSSIPVTQDHGTYIVAESIAADSIPI